MNSPGRKYWRDKHEPYKHNLSTTQAFNKNELSPKNGHNGMQMMVGQGKNSIGTIPGST